MVLVMLSLSACGSTLHKAVKSGDADAVRQAIDRGESTEISTWAGSPVNPAIENDDLAIIKLLHEGGAQILPAHLTVATKAGAVSTYAYLRDAGADIKGCYLDQDYPGWWGNNEFGSIIPPLGSAIARRDSESVERLLELGAPTASDCTVPTGLGEDYRFSSILAAGIVGDPKIIDLLIRAGANPNSLSTGGQTPLAHAAERGHYEAARVLLANGAFHTYQSDLTQPIEYAIDTGHQDIVDLLVYAGAVRPVRKDPYAGLKKAADNVVDGIIVIGLAYILVEGIKSGAFGDGAGGFGYSSCKVYVTNYQSSADYIVYLTDYQSSEQNEQIIEDCSLTSYPSSADISVYLTNYQSSADIVIHRSDFPKR